MADAQEGSSPTRESSRVIPSSSTTTMTLFLAARARWADVWTRAVILPAWRRAVAIWVGCAIVAGILFGPTGMHPSDLTELALHHLGVGAALALTWLLVYAPTARLIVRADAAAYLRSLPGPRFAPLLIGGGAFIVLQLPWLALWTLGEGPRGLLVVALSSLLVLLLSFWRPPPPHAGWPSWKSPSAALRAIHLRALRRRAGDALVRGAGLSLLAGASAGLFIRNNALSGPAAASIGASVIAVVLVPAYAGVLLVILGAHRQTAWLASTLGIAPATRTTALVFAVFIVQLSASVLALLSAAAVAEPPPRTLLELTLVTLGTALGASLGCARALLASEDSPTVAARSVVGALATAALALLCLGIFGALGVLAFLAAALLSLALL